MKAEIGIPSVRSLRRHWDESLRGQRVKGRGQRAKGGGHRGQGSLPPTRRSGCGASGMFQGAWGSAGERARTPIRKSDGAEAYVRRFNRGLADLETGRTNSAEQTFRALVAAYPESFEAHEYLARALQARRASAEAVAEFEAAIALSPGAATLYFDEARALGAAHQFDRALALVEKGRALEPTSFYGALTEGLVAQSAGQPARAERALQDAIRLNPALSVAHYELGRMAETRGDLERARTEYPSRARRRQHVRRSASRARPDEHREMTRRQRTQVRHRARIGWRPIAALVFVALVVVTAAWLRHPHAVTSVNGEPLGHLPAGVSASDLNLLLVTLDTTRADRVHAYGFDGIETPSLDRLAREGVLFEQAVAPAPLTLPAHSSTLHRQVSAGARRARQRRLLPRSNARRRWPRR